MRHTNLLRRLLASGVLAALAVLFIVAAEPAYATTIVPGCARTTAANAPPPSLDCALQTFTNVARFIMGITGSAALLMFVWGGFTLLTSGGVEAKVTQGKTVIKNAVIGIVIVLTAFYIIDYFVYALRGRSTHTVGEACFNGKGKYVSVGANTVECRYNCAAIAAEETGARRHECMASPPSGYTCDDYVCPGTQRCCIGPEPEIISNTAP